MGENLDANIPNTPPTIERPTEPDWIDLQRQLDTKANGANIHKATSRFHNVKHAWELGEMYPWNEESRKHLENCIKGFFESLR